MSIRQLVFNIEDWRRTNGFRQKDIAYRLSIPAGLWSSWVHYSREKNFGQRFKPRHRQALQELWDQITELGLA